MRKRETKLAFDPRLGTVLGGLLLSAAMSCSHQEGPAASPSAPGASSAEPAGATGAQTDLAGKGASVFVVHDVSDFEGFKKYFESGAGVRAEGGVKGYLLSKLDDGRIVIHFFADDVAKVEAALHADNMKRYLERDGAPDASLVWVTENVVAKVPATPPAGQTYSLFLRVHVADFAALKSGFEERHALFAAEGVIGEGLHRSTSKADIAILHFMGTDRAKLEALPQQKAFVELMKKAGRSDDAKPFLGVDVARSRPQ